jgi:hypothetical protein
MWLQFLLVLLLVAGSFIYAAWALLPQAARRSLAQGLLRWPLPLSLASYLQQAARAQAGCNCSGCDRAPANVKKSDRRGPTDALLVKPLVFHPRKRD